MVTANQEREKQVAVERIVGFAEEFGKEHLILACHGAFPLMLTPDLLYQMFRKDVKQTVGQALAKAKEVAKKERNLFWLLYFIYGDPDLYFEDIST